jgi:hypothetical protein
MRINVRYRSCTISLDADSRHPRIIDASRRVISRSKPPS